MNEKDILDYLDEDEPKKHWGTVRELILAWTKGLLLWIIMVYFMVANREKLIETDVFGLMTQMFFWVILISTIPSGISLWLVGSKRQPLRRLLLSGGIFTLLCTIIFLLMISWNRNMVIRIEPSWLKEILYYITIPNFAGIMIWVFIFSRRDSIRKKRRGNS